MTRQVRTTLSVVEEWIGGFAGRTILDVGCGHGALARALAGRGATVTGLDPQAEAVAAAQANVPGATFRRAGAEAIPFADRSFDGAVMLNALHHVPLALMRPAIGEVVRVSAGAALLIEPLAEGGFFEAVRLVDDETEIRAAAQAAIQAAVASGEVRLSATFDYDDRRPYRSVDGFIAKVVEVDPARAEIAAREAGRIAEVIDRVAERAEDGGYVLVQPHRAHLLTRPA